MITCSRCGEQNSDEFAYCGDCGSAIGSGPFAIQSTINGGRYRIDKLIGQGGMGSVYRATDMRLRRDVALKVLHAELVAHPTARRRMTQEAEALARIEHPNVVRVIDVFDENQLLVMVLEFVTGGDLARMVQPGGLSEAQVVPLMVGVLAGLEAVHQAGLVHRDMKPGNVLLTDKGVPKITDLGVARDSKAKERTRLGAALGTPEYMSPEQIQGLVVDARCDIYAAGIVLYELLTGVKPYDATTDFDIQAAHVRDPPNLARLRGGVSEPVIGVIARALAKAPAERWVSAEAMRAALRGAAPFDDRTHRPVRGLKPSVPIAEPEANEPSAARREAAAQWAVEAEAQRAARMMKLQNPTYEEIVERATSARPPVQAQAAWAVEAEAQRAVRIEKPVYPWDQTPEQRKAARESVVESQVQRNELPESAPPVSESRDYKPFPTGGERSLSEWPLALGLFVAIWLAGFVALANLHGFWRDMMELGSLHGFYGMLSDTWAWLSVDRAEGQIFLMIAVVLSQLLFWVIVSIRRSRTSANTANWH